MLWNATLGWIDALCCARDSSFALDLHPVVSDRFSLKKEAVGLALLIVLEEIIGSVSSEGLVEVPRSLHRELSPTALASLCLDPRPAVVTGTLWTPRLVDYTK